MLRLFVSIFAMTVMLPGWAAIDPQRLSSIKAATPFITVDTRPKPVSGSGFLVFKDQDRGLIVTNVHVVEHGDNRDIEVAFFSGTRDAIKLPARILALDRATDLAVLEVRGKGLPAPVELGNSDLVQETQELFIVGYPFGSRLATNRDTPTITIGRGTVSSRRLDINDHTYLLQVDGDINPGNSGGPVTDNLGNVIGVSVTTVLQTNIAFAIPSNSVRNLLNGQIGNLHAERNANGILLLGEKLEPMEAITSARLFYGPKSKVSSHFDSSTGHWSQPSGKIVTADIELDAHHATATITGKPGDTLIAQLAVKTSRGERYAAPFEVQIRELGAELKGPAVLPKGKRRKIAASNDATPSAKLNDLELVTRVLTRSGLNEFIDSLNDDTDLLFNQEQATPDEKTGQKDIKERLTEILSQSWDRERIQQHYSSIFMANLDKAHARTMADLFALPMVRKMHINLSAFSAGNRESIKKFAREADFKSAKFKALLKKYRRINEARQLSSTMYSALQTTTLAVARLVNDIQPISTRMNDSQVDIHLQPILDSIDSVLKKGALLLLAMQYRDTKIEELDDYLALSESDAYRWFSTTELKAFTTLLSAQLALAETDLRKLLREAQREAAGVSEVGSLEGLTPEEAVGKILETYSKAAVVQYLIKKGDGSISIQDGSGIRLTFGRPRQDLITHTTILNDMKRNKIDLATLATRLDEEAIEAAYRDRRLNAMSAARSARSRALNLQRSRTEQVVAASRACAAQCYVVLEQCSSSPTQKMPVKIGNTTRNRSCSYVYNNCMRKCRSQARAVRLLLQAKKRAAQY